MRSKELIKKGRTKHPAPSKAPKGGNFIHFQKQLRIYEQTLHESEERYRRLVEYSPDAVFLHNQGKFVFVNEAGLELFGAKSPEDLIGRSVFDIVHPEYREEVKKRIRSLKKKPFSPLTEQKIIRLDGSPVDIEVFGTPFTFQGKPAVQVVMRNIQERKQVEKRIRFQANILCHINDAVIATDNRHQITYWNRGAENLYGLKYLEVSGQFLKNIYQCRWLKLEDEKKSLKVLAEVGEWKGENIHVKKNGKEIYVESSTQILKDENNVSIGFLIIARDISVRKQMEGSLQQLSGRILQLQDDERRRIARVLHDTTAQNLAAIEMTLTRFCNPTHQKNLKMQGALSESLKLVEECSRQVRTVSYLLHPPMLDEIGLASALRWYSNGFSSRSGISVHLDLPSHLKRLSPEIETALFRIVQESFTNIHRHSGSLTAEVQITLKASKIILEITDTGHGMSSNTLKKAAGNSAEFGVGIAGMRERIRQLGGHLAIDSSESGTKVVAILPLDQARPS